MKPFLTAAVLSVFASAVPAQTPDEIAFAKTVLNSLQKRSFDAGREFCGYIGRNRAGDLIATRARRGRADSCAMRRPSPKMTAIASYHTHGRQDPGSNGEFPSAADVEGDMELGIDGYISTPGGRLWFVDGAAGEVRLICGPGCLDSDPNFRTRPFDPVFDRYTLKDLVILESR